MAGKIRISTQKNKKEEERKTHEITLYPTMLTFT